jgi:hypothetical protein
MLVVLLCLFTAAFIWQLSRAVDGNTLSWAYVAEWPVLGIYACYFAYQDLTGKRRVKNVSKKAQAREADDAAALARYNEELASRHGSSTPPLAGEDSNP